MILKADSVLTTHNGFKLKNLRSYAKTAWCHSDELMIPSSTYAFPKETSSSDWAHLHCEHSAC